MARLAGSAQRSDVLGHLWVAGAAIRRRCRSAVAALATARGGSEAPRALAGPHRGAEVEDRDRRIERSRSPRAALRRIGPWHGGRAQPRGAAAAAPERRVQADHAVGIQDAGARAVLHAAARSGGSAGSYPKTASEEHG